MKNKQENLGLLLVRVCRAHHNLAAQVMEKIGLHRGQPPILLALGQQDGMTHSELAAKMEVTPANITNMVKRIEQAGFVVRQRDTADERVSRVYLTDAGQAIQSEAKSLVRQMNEIAFAGFTEEEQTIMRNYLRRIHKNLQQAVA
jgi:DNA-binding MarR family transcriptional regulator